MVPGHDHKSTKKVERREVVHLPLNIMIANGEQFGCELGVVYCWRIVYGV